MFIISFINVLKLLVAMYPLTLLAFQRDTQPGERGHLTLTLPDIV